MPYDRQLMIMIKTPKGYDIVTDATKHLGMKGARKETECCHVELDPTNTDDVGRVITTPEFVEAIQWLGEAGVKKSRLYLVTHSSASSAGRLQGLNAAEYAEILCRHGKLPAHLARVTVVACHGGETVTGFTDVNFPEQLHRALGARKVYVSVAGYKTPISIASLAYENKMREDGRLEEGKNIVGHKMFVTKTAFGWVQKKRPEVKVIFYWEDYQGKKIPKRTDE